ncbi:hypothetical protein AMJ86_05915 [bacterium SM23_57]|jgi:hypothetical protein|nr:MAG: hypothetical protein AMJ86_05915 [bacterium SM23_57]
MSQSISLKHSLIDMIVHVPTLTKRTGKICISSRIELEKPLPHLPETLWYCFDEVHEDWLSPRSDGFAATGLLIAMYASEDLTIRGSFSPKLAYGLYDYRDVFHAWKPNLFKRVEIHFDQLKAVPQDNDQTGVATVFSGGVDSFYTLWSHLPQNQDIPEARVTHGLFVHGLDLRLDDETNFRAAAQTYAGLFNNLGLELILASTNAYLFSEFRIDWIYFHGAPMIGAALLMSPFLRRLYIPSGFPSYTKLVPLGLSPLTDHLLNTETLDFIHHGAATSRPDKLAVLVDWPVTYHHLRVCADKERLDILRNCSSCHKCYRTMTILAILDSLQKYNNFSQKLTIRDYIRWGLFTHLNVRHARDIRDKAMETRKYKMAFLIQVAIILRRIKQFTLRFFKGMLSEEQLYRIKRHVYKPDSDVLGGDV